MALVRPLAADVAGDPQGTGRAGSAAGLRAWRNGKNRVWRLDKALEDEQLFRFYIAFRLFLRLERLEQEISRIVQTIGLDRFRQEYGPENDQSNREPRHD